MNIASNPLNLPLFLVSRNRIKSEHIDTVLNYIGKKRALYERQCKEGKEENATEKAKKKIAKHIAFHLKTQPPCPTQRPYPTKHQLKKPADTKDSMHLPPNQYNIQQIPFADRRGAHGAHWKKSSTHKSLRNSTGPLLKPHFKFYNLERKSERCLQNKGVFLPNARERRATTRCMINSVQGCFHDPNEPGPEHYYPQNFMLAHNVSPVIKTKRLEPYRYIPNTSVAETPISIHPKYKGFATGPGYYENRYPNIASCHLHRLVFLPRLQLIIEREKRKKFRRLPYTKIKARQFFSPDWHHVIGHGHRHLFKQSRSLKLAKDMLKETKEIKEHKTESEKDVKELKESLRPKPNLYPGARYIHMINNPRRRSISLREKKSYTPLRPAVRFHSLQKQNVIIRRKTRGSNKRVAFNSCQERFKNSEKLPPLTPQQIMKIKRSLPLELRMRNYPIMTKQPDEIHAKLTSIPKRMLAPDDMELHKRLFRFSPIPPMKLLCPSGEVQLTNTGPYFDREVDPTLFFTAEDKKTPLLKSNMRGSF